METTTKPVTTPKDFFLHLGSIVALYTASISFINLLFSVIDIAFPDNLNYYVDPYSSSLRWAVAMIIIVFPIYLVLSWLIGKNLSKSPEKINLGIRKWLSYFTLFVAGVAIAVDLVALVNNFLGGELTARFVAKVIAVLGVAGIIFWYYIIDIRRKDASEHGNGKKFAIGVSILVLSSLVWSFSVMGSPSKARDLRFDSQRVTDLSSIQWQIVSFWQNAEKLPANMTELNDPISGFYSPKDPETGKEYEYSLTGKLTFKICADFKLPSDPAARNSLSNPKSVPYGGEFVGDGMTSENWTHNAGRTCFDRTIDPLRYPPRTKS